MKINNLELYQYRNIKEASFEFNDHLNIFVGDNGQGKTNIVEAIAYLSSGRSFRVNNDLILIEEGEEYSRIKAEIVNQEKFESLEIVMSEAGKYLKHNNRVLTKMSELIGLCNVVLFSPDDLQFFTQAPRKRRREIDYELGKSSTEYVKRLSEYNRLLMERNATLKSGKIDRDYINVLDVQMNDNSLFIINERKKFIDSLNKELNLIYQKLTLNKSHVEIFYQAPFDLKEENWMEELNKKVAESWQRDQNFKLSHVGIHRDDFVFKVNDKPVVNVLSQGQRRLLMIAYKIAVINWFISTTGLIPIFCMDDLFSELDEEKRSSVLTLLNPKLQVFITTTDINFIKTNKDKHIFHVKDGNISKEAFNSER